MNIRIRKIYMVAAAASAGMFSMGHAAVPLHRLAPPQTATAASWVTPSYVLTGDDREIMDRVVDALNDDRTLRGSRIDVVALNGLVTLSGSAPGETLAQRAAKDASAVAAPDKVINSLEIPSGA